MHANRTSLAKPFGYLSAVALLTCGYVKSEDLTTTDGRTFHEVSVTKVEPDGLSIRHSTGTAKLPVASLPEEVRSRHDLDAEKAAAYEKAKARKYAELEAMLRAAREKEQAKQTPPPVKLPKAFVVAPAEGEGLEIRLQSQAEVKNERAVKLRVELYREDEIAEILGAMEVKARLMVNWQRPDYDSASAEHFRVIVSDAGGNVIQRVTPEYRAPKQAGDGVYVNGIAVDLNQDLGEEFRVRVVDWNANGYADFQVRCEY
ncbi:hypothetical protein [Luteolibacter luteus]|uniref:Uncharacterized protein n=1 Tax=Luteolibacter luteus TaxID=2728835 RepID=A0A858RE59_9BACT|nr:hypothetical protein [Luteolibacter luteus]QJE94844.1 hypothetical protein HHL09_03305 [Luteolibacter luteus]